MYTDNDNDLYSNCQLKKEFLSPLKTLSSAATFWYTLTESVYGIIVKVPAVIQIMYTMVIPAFSTGLILILLFSLYSLSFFTQNLCNIVKN